MNKYWAFIFFFFINAAEAQVSNDQNAQTVVHLLSYMAQDYGGAVQNGKVISEGEYQEQVEFAQIIRGHLNSLDQQSKKWAPLKTRGELLLQLVKKKEDAQNFSAFALSLKKDVIVLANIATTPKVAPNIKKGQMLYLQNCVSCHGKEGRGDGIDGKDMDPAPTNFHNQERLSQISPYGAFNTIKLGVNGTGMQAFSEQFKDEEIWDLSFYVTHLRYGLDQKENEKKEDLKLSLEEMSLHSDQELAKKYFHSENEQDLQKVAVLRMEFVNRPPPPASAPEHFLEITRNYLKETESKFYEGNQKEALRLSLFSYLEGIEPLEPQLKRHGPKIVSEIEFLMSRWRDAIQKNDTQKFKEVTALIVQKIEEIKTEMVQKESDDWATFSMAAGIILREGLEAVLIIATILTVIKTFQIQGLALWVHAGWISAIFLGVISWFFTGMLLQGAQRELMEAVGSFIAVFVLLSMGLWLHSKREIEKWKKFIQAQTQGFISSGKLMGIAGISFVATFREVFESVVFLRALWINGQSASNNSLLAGVFFAFILVIFLAYLFIHFGAKLPLSKIFSGSAILMLLLAVILAGKGTHALQECGILGINEAPWGGLEILGIFPSFEVATAQILVAIVAFTLWFKAQKRQN